jgi:hypothetical protein
MRRRTHGAIVSAAAGWYADPSGVVGQLRWWDGTRWTDHVTPDPTQVAAVATAGGGAAEGATGASQPPPPTGMPTGASEQAAGQGGAGAGSAWTEAAQRPVWQVDTPVPSSGGSSVRTGLIIAAVVGVVLLGLVAVLVLGVVRGGPVSFEVGPDVSFEDGWATNGETVDAGPLSVGEQMSGEVPQAGDVEATLEVDTPGTYTFDVRGSDGFDGMLEVIGPSGDRIAENDDRDSEVADRTGSDTLDPYLELDLSPGEHRVTVRGWAGDEGPFTLTVERR